MILTREFNLNVLPGSTPLLIRASKKDNSSRLVFFLFTGVGVLDIPAGTSAMFRGSAIQSPARFSIVRAIPRVTVDLTAGMTSEAGRIPFEIVLTNGTCKLVTATLFLDIRG